MRNQPDPQEAPVWSERQRWNEPFSGPDYVFGMEPNAFPCRPRAYLEAPARRRSHSPTRRLQWRLADLPEEMRYGTGGPSCADNMYAADLLRSSLSGIEILTLMEHDGRTSESKGHVGTAAAVDLLARKDADRPPWLA
jgi:hypothetical protein